MKKIYGKTYMNFTWSKSDKEINQKRSEIIKWLHLSLGIDDAVITDCPARYRQQLTHQNIIGHFVEVQLRGYPYFFTGLFEI